MQDGHFEVSSMVLAVSLAPGHRGRREHPFDCTEVTLVEQMFDVKRSWQDHAGRLCQLMCHNRPPSS